MITKTDKAKDFVISNIRSDMASFEIGELELRERVTILRDIEHFNFKEDESVWKQKRGKSYEVAEVYFDDVWVCDIDERDIGTTMNYKFFKGFLKGYESGRIRLNRWLALLADEKAEVEAKQAKEEEKKKIEALPQSTPEEKIAKEVIKELAKEQNAPPTDHSTTA